MSRRSSRRAFRPDRPVAFTLVELLVVVGILTILVAALLATIGSAKQRARNARLASEAKPDSYGAAQAVVDASAQASLPFALVRSFAATVDLTPRLSVGTPQPESIYTAKVNATLEATAPAKDGGGECLIELPVPPQVISLAELSVSVNDRPSDDVALRDGKLTWRGPLPGAGSGEPATFRVTYAAVGRGLFSLDTPPGNIIDRYHIDLAANGSDVRMLELSLQPTSTSRTAARTSYVWEYKRLMFGRPIVLDVLGIAPIDRLGELRWLGPLSVIVFGLALGLISRGFVANGIFDRWLLLLILGTFTGAYPLMYFAQEFVSFTVAMTSAGAIVLLVIALRAIATLGWRVGLFGVTLPGALVMTVALIAAIYPGLQGILLTAIVLALFALGMFVAPRLKLEPARDSRPAALSTT